MDSPCTLPHHDGITGAFSFGSDCKQVYIPGEAAVSGAGDQSEDCLFLNIWKPRKQISFYRKTVANIT